MPIDNCAQLWRSAERKNRAGVIDKHHPMCGCESHSLRSPEYEPIPSQEIIARILTSPDGYDIFSEEVLTAKLVAAYSSGISVVRQGASDEEIKLTVRQLTEGGAEPSSLFGAAILPVGEIRGLGNGDKWFCVYDTEADQKLHHADIVGTFPVGLSKNQMKKAQSHRRGMLKELLEAHLYETQTLEDLINVFRSKCV